MSELHHFASQRPLKQESLPLKSRQEAEPIQDTAVLNDTAPEKVSSIDTPAEMPQESLQTQTQNKHDMVENAVNFPERETTAPSQVFEKELHALVLEETQVRSELSNRNLSPQAREALQNRRQELTQQYQQKVSQQQDLGQRSMNRLGFEAVLAGMQTLSPDLASMVSQTGQVSLEGLDLDKPNNLALALVVAETDSAKLQSLQQLVTRLEQPPAELGSEELNLLKDYGLYFKAGKVIDLTSQQELGSQELRQLARMTEGLRFGIIRSPETAPAAQLAVHTVTRALHESRVSLEALADARKLLDARVSDLEANTAEIGVLQNDLGRAQAQLETKMETAIELQADLATLEIAGEIFSESAGEIPGTSELLNPADQRPAAHGSAATDDPRAREAAADTASDSSSSEPIATGAGGRAARPNRRDRGPAADFPRSEQWQNFLNRNQIETLPGGEGSRQRYRMPDGRTLSGREVVAELEPQRQAQWRALRQEISAEQQHVEELAQRLEHCLDRSRDLSRQVTEQQAVVATRQHEADVAMTHLNAVRQDPQIREHLPPEWRERLDTESAELNARYRQETALAQQSTARADAALTDAAQARAVAQETLQGARNLLDHVKNFITGLGAMVSGLGQHAIASLHQMQEVLEDMIQEVNISSTPETQVSASSEAEPLSLELQKSQRELTLILRQRSESEAIDLSWTQQWSQKLQETLKHHQAQLEALDQRAVERIQSALQQL